MLAAEQDFLNSIKEYSVQELKGECLMLFNENIKLKLNQSANERINTETYLQYEQLKMLNDSLIRENKELKAALERSIDKYDLRARSTFGRKTESLLTLIDAASEKIAEVEDEAQCEPGTEKASSSPRVIDFASRKHAGEKHDGKSSRCKTSRIGRIARSMEDLPKEIHYNLNTAELDKKYGAGNWRIAFWHSHVALEKIDTPYYQRVIYTPSISVGLEHRLYSESYENPLIDRSVVSPSMMADILYRKFAMGLPANRQATDYQMQGIDLSKQTIINWTNTIAPKLFRPLVEYLTECLMKYRYTQNDETYIRVNKDDRGPGHKSFIWVHSSSECLKCNPIIVFCYEATRNTDHLRSFYKEFRGYITCDAYVSYKVLEDESGGNIRVTGCMMHCRRYFAEAFFVNDIASMSDEQLKELPETRALFLIRDIYIEENRLSKLSADERLTLRQEKVSPLVDQFFRYIHKLDQSDEVFSDRMTKAIGYAINQEEHLRVFLTDGNISCDNGHAERIIRSYSIGRANWLFADTILGAEVNALMYSIVETAKANSANVLIYLRYLLEKMPAHASDANRSYLAAMVPWSEEYKTYEDTYKHDRKYMLQGLFIEPMRPRTSSKAEATESYRSTPA